MRRRRHAADHAHRFRAADARGRASGRAGLRSAAGRGLAGRPKVWTKPFCHQVGVAHRRLLFEALALDPAMDFATVEYLGNTGSVALPMTAAIGIEQGISSRAIGWPCWASARASTCCCWPSSGSRASHPAGVIRAAPQSVPRTRIHAPHRPFAVGWPRHAAACLGRASDKRRSAGEPSPKTSPSPRASSCRRRYSGRMARSTSSRSK